MSKYITHPVVVFWIIASGLVAYVLGRALPRAIPFPRTAIIVLTIGALGTAVLSVLSLRETEEPIGTILAFVVLTGAVAFAIVFGVTWLLSA